jgi:hypothetical protein
MRSAVFVASADGASPQSSWGSCILLPYLALCRCQATCQRTCGAIRTLAEGGAIVWDHGCLDAFELDLAGARRLLGEIMVSQEAFWSKSAELFSGKISAPM